MTAIAPDFDPPSWYVWILVVYQFVLMGAMLLFGGNRDSAGGIE